MDSTEQATTSEERTSSTVVWSLVLALHPDPSREGRRVVVDAPVILGREHKALDALGDRRLSRAHARVVVEGDALRIEDQGSRNGTFVDGERVERALLCEGSVVGVGSLLLVATRAPAVSRPPENPRVAAVSAAMTAILEEVSRLATRRDPVVFFGESGTGKGLLAEEIHLASGRSGAFSTIRCGVPSAEALLLDEGPAERLASLRGGTLLVDRLEDATPQLQAALVALLDESARSEPGTADVRVVATSSLHPRALEAEGRLRPDLAARLGGWSMEVPPLRARPEDVVAIGRKLLEGHESVPELRSDFALALLRHDWPGNVHALEAVLARAMLEDHDGELRLTPRVARLLERPDEERREPAADEASIVIAKSGRWFTAANGERVSLESRKTLASILEALVRAHEAGDARPLAVSELLAIAWPGERVLPRAGASRVYVAITSLRRMGLRDVLERTSHGYRIDPESRVRIG